MGNKFRSGLLPWRERSDRNGISPLRGKLRRGQTTEATVRATMVVRLTPRLNHRLSLGKRSQFFTGKTFVSEATVKALHLSVLPRAAWFDAGRSYIDAIQEFSHSLANEFGAVVTENELWRATDREHINQ